LVHLGASASIASLQAEHLRLCINSYALQAAGDVSPSLHKAFNAAVALISAHSKSSQGDLALSFAIDVRRNVYTADSSTIPSLWRKPLSF
jgi:hypothetical protein